MLGCCRYRTDILAKLDPQERLIFSNAYVSVYIGNNLNSEPATMKEVLKILK